MPDGRIARFEVPEGTTPEQAHQMMTAHFTQSAHQQDKPFANAKQMEETRPNTSIMQDAGNFLSGAVRGAGSIGATILAPYDIAKDAINGKGLSLESNRQRRSDIDSGLQMLGANPESGFYTAGKIGGEIAGTAGIGGVLAKGAAAIPQLAKFAPALQSGGFNLGPAQTASPFANAAIRAGAGAAVGGTQVGITNPEDAATGALVGGIMPGGVKVAGAVGNAVKNGAGVAARNILGASTGTGAESIRGAYQAGKTGSQEFLGNMRGNTSFNDVVDNAKQALSNMRADRANAYRSGMIDIKNDASVIDFAPIQKAMDNISSMGSFKGQQINKNAAGTVSDLAETVGNWSKLNPSEYHTPEGLDALKQAVGDIRDSTQFGTAARRAADSVYNSVKNQISLQAPTYNKVMKDYAEASTQLSEVEKALSLGDKASKDTAIRKLQSLMRNNVQTNYGNRLTLAQLLSDKGGVDLLPAIAGQSMSSAMPRGIVGAGEKVGALGAAIMNPASIPGLLAAAPFTSPRIMGEAMYGLGSMSRAGGNAANKLGGMAGRVGLLNPGLLDAEQSILRSAPLMAISGSP